MKCSDHKGLFFDIRRAGDIRHLKRYIWLLIPFFMLVYCTVDI